LLNDAGADDSVAASLMAKLSLCPMAIATISSTQPCILAKNMLAEADDISIRKKRFCCRAGH
jgi:hypothetical protein